MRLHIGRLVVGFLCLAIALLLAVLSVMLPEGKVVFMMGENNAPMIPVVVLAALGLGRLVTAWGR